MTQYQGNDVFPAGFEEVSDGTGRDAASVNVGLEALADRTIWLRNRTKLGHVVASVYNPLVYATFTSTNFAPSSIARVVNDAKAGDLLAIDLAVNLQYVGTTNNWGNVRVAVVERFDTPNPTTYYPAGTIMIMGATGTTTYAAGASLITEHTVHQDGNLKVVVEGRAEPSANVALRIVGSFGLRVLKQKV